MRKTKKAVVTLFVLIGLLSFAAVAMAGDLQPPGAPGSTMKTLDEVEPRIPIAQADIPLIIKQSGSYYLTSDVQVDPCAPAHGITVEANDVTIDLMGYSLIGPGTGAGNYSGIRMGGRSNVEIRNGTVRNFGFPCIYEINSNGKGHRVIGVRAVLNGYGIYLPGSGHLIKDCTAADNTTGNGISAGSGCTVIGNTAYINGSHGISAGAGSTVTGNTVFSNQDNGINAGYGCTITGNTAYSNQSNGINAGNGCTVTGNTARSNNQANNNASYAGIRVNDNCLVKGNTLQDNLQNNIYVLGYDNAIEENLVTDSTNGIYFNSAGNFYANNRASGNSTNYAGTLPSGGGDGGGNAQF